MYFFLPLGKEEIPSEANQKALSKLKKKCWSEDSSDIFVISIYLSSHYLYFLNINVANEILSYNIKSYKLDPHMNMT